jgi:heme/copper-type cytochrome/quinol oxidase subunit 3
MPLALAQIRRRRRLFGWFLLASLVIFALSLAYAVYRPTAPLGNVAAPSFDPLALVVAAASLLTSTVSLGGFVFTTLFAWRKEKREQQQSDIDLEKKKLEVEKLRLELQGKKEPPND